MKRKSNIDKLKLFHLGENAARQKGLRLKICGMKYQDNISEVSSLEPDYLGFIFYEKSSRFFTGSIPKLPNSIKKVGVFVNASIEDILEKVDKHDLQLVQLHGEESPEFCLKLKRYYQERNHEVVSTKIDSSPRYARKNYQIEIIKVFPLNEDFNFEKLSSYESVCDYFLFDTKGKLPGGNGFTFNWNVLKNYPFTKPYFLSGGIGIEESENIKSFFKTNASNFCYAIDVNSKFEIEAGLKDVKKIKRFKVELKNNMRT